MEHRILIVVDMQKDFIDGSLGTAEAQHILPAAAEKIRNFDGTVLFTMDTHREDYLSTQEGKNLPVLHCIKGTDGWQITESLRGFSEKDGVRIFEKDTFASTELAEHLCALHKKMPITSIELIGLCTDICVVSNALLLHAFLPEVPVFVDSSCCAGVTPQAHEAALQTMKSCQITVL